ncbi:hypothetical protein RND81_02G198500 [Saponaria officinalis]|uniref:Uncharacterized protein n=1 Tax=Saponaria officinalis TaxID=3572 RepID=A0AAW1MVQ0_SAPOF
MSIPLRAWIACSASRRLPNMTKPNLTDLLGLCLCEINTPKTFPNLRNRFRRSRFSVFQAMLSTKIDIELVQLLLVSNSPNPVIDRPPHFPFARRLNLFPYGCHLVLTSMVTT